MKTEEGNKLIAEFITDEPEVLKHDLQKAGTVESMHYHDAWDWLMPVVAKINARGYALEGVRILNRIADYAGCGHLGGTYREVVSFIQWYNNQ